MRECLAHNKFAGQLYEARCFICHAPCLFATDLHGNLPGNIVANCLAFFLLHGKKVGNVKNLHGKVPGMFCLGAKHGA